MTLRTLATWLRTRIVSAVEQLRADRDPRRLLRDLGEGLAAMGLFAALVFDREAGIPRCIRTSSTFSTNTAYR